MYTNWIFFPCTDIALHQPAAPTTAVGHQPHMHPQLRPALLVLHTHLGHRPHPQLRPVLLALHTHQALILQMSLMSLVYTHIHQLLKLLLFQRHPPLCQIHMFFQVTLLTPAHTLLTAHIAFQYLLGLQANLLFPLLFQIQAYMHILLLLDTPPTQLRVQALTVNTYHQL